jgi:hypothetical protein
VFLTAARLDRWEGSQIGREGVRCEGFDLHPEEAEHGNAQVQHTVGAVDDYGYGLDAGLVLPGDFESFLDPPTFSDDVLHDSDLFAGGDTESAAEDEFALFLFDEDEPAAELSGDFLADDQTTHGRGDDGADFELPDPVSESAPQVLHDGHFLQGLGTLKELTAMHSAAQNEMAFEKSPGLTEDFQNFGFCHRRECKVGLNEVKDESVGRVKIWWQVLGPAKTRSRGEGKRARPAV